MTDLTLGIALAGGILSFFSPCVLPLIPGYLAYLSGAPLEGPHSDGQGVAQKARSRIFLNSVLFTTGFSSVFIFLGLLLAGVFGVFGPDSQIWLSRVGGSVIIIFGLHTLELLEIPFLMRTRSIAIPIRNKGYVGSLAMGSSFGLGWTPCFGPILASILVLAGTAGSASIGGTLLGLYSLGLAIPFLLTGLFTDRLSVIIAKNTRHLRWFNSVSGIFLLMLGVIVFTNSFARLLAIIPGLGGFG